MKKITTGILAHVDAGKTTLSESLLFSTGAIKKIGRVDSGDAFLDTDRLEKERGITIYSKNARISLGDKELVLIDTPGHVDFSTEMERALSVMDYAILLISAPSGIQSHTKTLWTLLKHHKIPVFIFINKMDMFTPDKNTILSELKKNLSDSIVDFSSYDDEFFESVASCEEALMETYLETGILDDSLIARAILNRSVFPVFFGSALKIEGISEFINALERFIHISETTDDMEFSGRVYKINRDSFGKRLTFIKVLSGSLKVKSLLNDEKINELRIYNGEKYEAVQEVFAGDICAATGLNTTYNGQAFGKAPKSAATMLEPALSYAVHYPDDMDSTRMLKILKELEEEDPSLNVEHREQTKELYVSLMGDIQTEVLKRIILDRFALEVTFGEGKICYRETIDAAAVGIGHFEPLRHYAEVQLLLEPLERGSGMQFETDISEDILAKNWQRLILTHMMEREHRGVLTGSPITDIKLTLVAGRAHNKHTEGGDFRQATYRAIRQGLMQLLSSDNCRLLEPYYEYSLEIPDNYVGRAMNDITGMNGTASIAENDYDNHCTVLTGKAPVACMNGYIKEVNAYTKGLGHLSVALSGYELCHNEEEILSGCRYNPDSDLRNPSSSVFCMHGAGTVVPWYEVDEYKHLDYSIENASFMISSDTEAIAEIENANKMRRRREYNSSDIAISLEEIDNIIHQSGHANENGRSGSYKGISKVRRDKKREENRLESGPVIYKAIAPKEKYLLVDGYNVIHAWNELNELVKDSLDAASGKLNDILTNYQAITGINLIVVYDAYKQKGHTTEELQYHNITIVYTKESQTADQYIERYAHQNASKYDITVVTSDGLEQIIVTGEGCHLISSREFEQHVALTCKDFYEKYGVK